MSLEDIKPRTAVRQPSHVDLDTLFEAVEELGATQRIVAEALRETITRIRSTADDTNQRIRALEEAVYGLRDLLTNTGDR